MKIIYLILIFVCAKINGQEEQRVSFAQELKQLQQAMSPGQEAKTLTLSQEIDKLQRAMTPGTKTKDGAHDHIESSRKMAGVDESESTERISFYKKFIAKQGEKLRELSAKNRVLEEKNEEQAKIILELLAESAAPKKACLCDPFMIQKLQKIHEGLKNSQLKDMPKTENP